MRWDKEQADRRRRLQDGLLRAHLTHELHAYSPHYRQVFDAARLEVRGVRKLSDLAGVGPTSWSQVAAQPASFVLRPDEQSIARWGRRRLVAAVTSAKLRGRTRWVNETVIDPMFKPVHWELIEGVPVGYSMEDLSTLGVAGERLLALAGIGRADVLATVFPPAPTLGAWQLVEGARRAGVAAVHLGRGAKAGLVHGVSPTALAGRPADLVALFERFEAERVIRRRRMLQLRTVMAVVDAPLATKGKRALRAAGQRVGADDLEVVQVWAPRGVRALWGECRGGLAFHTFPDLEYLELIGSYLDLSEVEGSGELLWSSLAWRGTTYFRLRTGVAVALRDGTCESCGRIGPRVSVRGAGAVSIRRRAAGSAGSATAGPVRRTRKAPEPRAGTPRAPGAGGGREKRPRSGR